jgi:colanic acid biosynthesis glycosyl transferase WcaI
MALMASLAIGGVDLVICISPPLQMGVTAWLIAKSRGARLVLQLQDIVPDAAMSVGMMREGKVIGLSRHLEKFVYARAQLIAVISKGFVDNLMSKGVPEAKVRVLPNWVETARFTSEVNPKVRAELGASDGDTLLVHAGNMGAKQGLETVVDAAAELADESIVIALIGDGYSRRALEERARRLSLHNLRFFPLQADLPATLAAADLLIISQRGELVDSVAPSKMLSYMAAGKPIVASVNELSEAGQLVVRAKCGVVVAPNDPHRLAHAVRELQHQKEALRALGEAGRRYVAENYAPQHILAKWAELLECAPV